MRFFRFLKAIVAVFYCYIFPGRINHEDLIVHKVLRMKVRSGINQDEAEKKLPLLVSVDM